MDLATTGVVVCMGYVTDYQGNIIFDRAYDGEDRLIWVAYLPGFTAVLKIAIVIPLLFRHDFVFSSVLAFAQKAIHILLLAGAVVGLRLVIGRFVTGGDYLSVGIRLAAICVPPGLFAVKKFFWQKNHQTTL